MFKIHYTTLLLMFISYIYGYIYEYLIFFFLVLLHELGHLITIKLHNNKFKKLTIMPFGCILDYDGRKKNSFLISISGITVNVILYFLDFYPEYNLLLILVNLIPIYPLDGYLILKSLRVKKDVLNRLSLLMLISLILVSIFYKSLLMIFIAFYLLYRHIEYYKNKDLISANEIYKSYLK